MKNKTNFEKWVSAIAEDPSATNFNFNSDTKKIEFTYKPDVPSLPYTPTYTLHMMDSDIFLGAYCPVRIIEATFNQIMTMYNATYSSNSETPSFIYDKKRSLASVQIKLDNNYADKKKYSEFLISSDADLLALRLDDFMKDFQNIIKATTQLSDAITSISKYTANHCKSTGSDDNSEDGYDDFNTDWSEVCADEFYHNDDCDDDIYGGDAAGPDLHSDTESHHKTLPGSRYYERPIDNDEYWTSLDDETVSRPNLFERHRKRIARYIRKRRRERIMKKVRKSRNKHHAQLSHSLSTDIK